VEKINDYPLDFPDDLKPAIEDSIEYYRKTQEMIEQYSKTP